MKLSRRKMLALTGGIVGGAGAVGGSGAFDTVQADRTVSLSTTGDSSADLGLEATNGEITGTETVNGNDVLTLESTSLNENASAEFNDSILVSNNGTDDVSLHVELSNVVVNGQTILDFVVDGSSIVGQSNSVSLSSGSSVSIDLQIDIRGSGVDGSDLSSVNQVTFVANSN